MKIKHVFKEHVVMTDVGLLKVCVACKQCKPLEEFKHDRMAMWKRVDVCKACEKKHQS